MVPSPTTIRRGRRGLERWRGPLEVLEPRTLLASSPWGSLAGRVLEEAYPLATVSTLLAASSRQASTFDASGAASPTLTNQGAISIASGNRVDVSGSFAQTGTGTLSIALGGPPDGGRFGQLVVAGNPGTATLAGTLDVTLDDGFVPTPGQVFPILSFASSTGHFSTVNLPASGGAPLFTTLIRPTEFDLVAISPGTAPLATPTTPTLLPADDSGAKGDAITNVTTPHLVGTSIPGDAIEIVDAGGTVLGSAAVARDGTYSVAFASPLGDGTHPASVRLVDVAGNVSDASPPIALTIIPVESAASETSDFDGDGQGDLGLFRPSTAQWIVSLSGGGTIVPTPVFGMTDFTDIPVPGDYDGSGKTELAVFRPSTAQWFLTGHPQPISFGAPNLFDIPVPGDYDGIGRTELAVFRPSTAQWIILNPVTDAQRVISFGAQDLFDIPVPGDYDGIGRTEPAVFRPSTGQWIILNPETETQRTVNFGAQGLFDLPVPGDYDGSGETEVAVFRPSTGEWIIPLDDGEVSNPTFGAPNLVEIPLEAPVGSLLALGKARVKSPSATGT